MGVYIIAEAGVNHNGDMGMAMELAERAAKAGADAVKFQTFRADKLAVAQAEKADYQRGATGPGSQIDMLRPLELDREAHLALMEKCRQLGIDFLSSPFDCESVDMLAELGFTTIKIPSGEITNIPYLRRMGAFRRIILSTGMSALGDIELALDELRPFGSEIILLHCNTQYPTPVEDVNLRAMLTLRRAFGLKTGYSDHTEGIEIALAAAALGACVIEKHFTLDRTLSGPDHKASIEPDGLERLVCGCRNIAAALGSGIKAVTASEVGNRLAVRKSIVAARDIQAGEGLDAGNLTVKRPGGGLSPVMWDIVAGKRADRDYHKDEYIDFTS